MVGRRTPATSAAATGDGGEYGGMPSAMGCISSERGRRRRRNDGRIVCVITASNGQPLPLASGTRSSLTRTRRARALALRSAGAGRSRINSRQNVVEAGGQHQRPGNALPGCYLSGTRQPSPRRTLELRVATSGRSRIGLRRPLCPEGCLYLAVSSPQRKIQTVTCWPASTTRSPCSSTLSDSAWHQTTSSPRRR